MVKARVYSSGFGATFAVVFVLICRLGGFPLSAVDNRFEMRSQLKPLFAIVLQNPSLLLLSTIWWQNFGDF